MRMLALAAALLALAPVAIGAMVAPDDAIRARPVPLDPTDPAHRRIGRLTWLEGWVLSSRDGRFGGLSSLVALGDGHFMALADTGTPSRIDLTPRGPVVRLLPVLDTGVPGAEAKRDRDTESLTRDPATGRYWVGYEVRNVILRYGPDLAPLEASAHPLAMKRWPYNGGAESMVRMRDGRFLVIGETAGTKEPGGRQALLFPSDPTDRGVEPVRFAYVPPPDGYDPSDATQLPDGRILVLNRRANLLQGFSAILTIVDPRDFREGAVVTGEAIATLGSPLTVDNMEGVAATVEHGRTIITLVSDDNFLPFERTLLMRFVLDDRP